MQDKVALVTGASRGIGQAIAIELGASGAKVIGTATSEDGAQAISDYLKEAGIAGSGMVLDVRSEESIADCVKAITTDHGAIEILVNNAGVTRDQLLMRMKTEDWEEVFTTNLRSVFLLSKACVRGMMKAKFGRIINISSVVAATGNAGQVNYAATKAGMIGFTKSLAREVAGKNVTVNAVAPGFIATDMTAELNDDQRAHISASIPMGRMGEPANIAKAVRYLASDDADYVTGHTLHVNGGMHME